ncbi:hypothetical protein EUGRSUZ_J00382 [Eucalyptus grandis]|uniref:Uncharacterized protein n=2 Tax=Eucalyptus grandis TaxID=71139 RepID=A0ACC3J1G7_EUCGR|nr:hypothetical protein EUGRSUZ_J00382 [Eucalyptus grandis]
MHLYKSHAPNKGKAEMGRDDLNITLFFKLVYMNAKHQENPEFGLTISSWRQYDERHMNLCTLPTLRL